MTDFISTVNLRLSSQISHLPNPVILFIICSPIRPAHFAGNIGIPIIHFIIIADLDSVKDFGLEDDTKLSSLARFPEVFSMEEEEPDEEGIWKTLEKALRSAAEGFVTARVREGEALKTDLCAKLDEMKGYVDFIEERSPQIVSEYRQKLTQRVQELLGDVKADESRLLTEVTVYADKICVDEEIVRLQSHISAMKKSLTDGGSIGRKLDFLAQEMNREANTILSKTTDLELSNCGIELKTLIEKVREQIQNIE